jgi:hypothetical protein
VRTVGTLSLSNGAWVLEADPHVLMMAKRIFRKIETTSNRIVTIPETPEVARDLDWFSMRYPLDIRNQSALQQQASRYVESIRHRDDVLSGKFKPRTFKLALPPREYQSAAAEVMLSQKAMILGDQVGLGKTCTSICVIAQKECQPTVIVCLTNLALQWKREVNRFLPKVTVHVVSKQTPYDVTNRKGEWPAVLIISYSKLRYWKEVISQNCKCVIFDEIQEIRREDSLKHKAAVSIAEHMEYRFGLTGSPVYNYGGEFYNVFKAINPGALGSETEFLREWCDGMSMAAKPRLKDSAAFGSWLRENHLMLRRTRADVERELPPLTKVTHFVEPNADEFKKSNDRARELARVLLQGTDRGAKFMAAAEFDALMRQTTGISKAVAVASFVDMLLRSGEPVVLFGWHRACFARDTRAMMFDGTTKRVDEVVVGDVLMGPDSRPRTVKNLSRGYGKMFRIVPNRGKPFICSQYHRLAVRNINGNNQTFTVDEFMKHSDRWKRDRMLYRANAITFANEQSVVEPWLLGYWLGDGAANLKDLRVSSADDEIRDELEVIAKRNNLKVSIWDSKGASGQSVCKQIAFTSGMRGPKNRNGLLRHFQSLGLNGNKRIPLTYQTASVADRRQLLAGLIDSDGHVCVGNGVGSVIYSAKDIGLSNDVAFLARSLGFAATVKYVKRIGGYGGSGHCHAVTISGDLTELPMRISRKRGLPRSGQKNVLHTGFSIEQVDDDDYFGFEVDGDHLFLLDDFTVVHNCYEIWLSELEAYKPSMYTGSESPAKKDAELQRFIRGETDLLIMSLRSGVGVDGLQHRCKTVVIGEFDWSPAVIEQNIGRVCRDGQKDPVMAYSLAVDSGADPFMMEVLGIKQDQVNGIRGESTFLDKKPDSMDLMKKLARTFLDKNA